jgi:hypothetical protein
MHTFTARNLASNPESNPHPPSLLSMKILRFSLLLFLPFFLFAVSCKHKEGGTGTKISHYNSRESHNVGRPCIDCHVTHGTNEYWYQAAGTIYHPDQVTTYPGSTVYLYTGINGTGSLVYTLEVDQKGNFYSTETIPYGTGLYPMVVSTEHDTAYMQAFIIQGNCNNCHDGNSNARITVN